MASEVAQRGPSLTNVASSVPPKDPNAAATRLLVGAEPRKDPTPKNVRILQTFRASQALLPFRPVSLPMGFQGLKMAPRLPARAPGGAQKGFNAAPEAPKCIPRGPRGATFEIPTRGYNFNPGLFVDKITTSIPFE